MEPTHPLLLLAGLFLAAICIMQIRVMLYMLHREQKDAYRSSPKRLLEKVASLTLAFVIWLAIANVSILSIKEWLTVLVLCLSAYLIYGFLTGYNLRERKQILRD